MGNLWLLIAAPATVLAAILFWKVFDIQHADYEQQRADVKVERAAFDVEFSKAWSDDGKPDPALVAKAREADEKRKKLEAEAEERKRVAQAQAQAEVDKLDALLNFPQPRKE